MPKRQAPEVNAGSMADIAFLLLIFFLVTSQMSKEAGMFQLLSEKQTEDTPPVDVNERNVIKVLVNDKNQILFGGKLVKLEEVPSLAKEMIVNADDKATWPKSRAITIDELQAIVDRNRSNLDKAIKEAPEKVKSEKGKLRKSELRLQALETFGEAFRKSEHVVNLMSTQGPDYGTYIQLKDKLKLAYRSLRDELAKKKLGRGWDDLSLEEKEMLKMVYKENISEAPIQ